MKLNNKEVEFAKMLYQSMFYFIQCNKFDLNNIDAKLLPECPRACDQKQCENINFAKHDSCKPKNSGIYASSYDCECVENTLWSTHVKDCYVIDQCKANICTGSECEFDLYGEHPSYKCKCSEETMGVHCDKPRNACESSFIEGQLTGNQACNLTGKGLRCIPFLGLNFYKCECQAGWTADKSSTVYPNCDIKIDPCESKICHYGYCQNDGQCKCDFGWTGDKCSTKTAVWFPWSPWSECEPKCGLNSTKKRTRKCSGFKGNSECMNVTKSKGDLEVSLCGKIKCIYQDTQTGKARTTSKVEIYLYFISFYIFQNFLV